MENRFQTALNEYELMAQPATAKKQMPWSAQSPPARDEWAAREGGVARTFGGRDG